MNHVNPLKKKVAEPAEEPQHNIPVVCRIRDIDQPYGTGTAILFNGTNDDTAIERLAIWLTLTMGK